MKEKKKRQAQVIILMMLTFLLLTSLTVKQKAEPVLSNEDFIRFHVVANSDSKEDQALKLLVRDELVKSINKELVDYTVQQETGIKLEQITTAEAVEISLDKEMAERYIESHLTEIEKQAEGVIAGRGYTYTAEAELGIRWIPEKTYGSVTFPPGNYEALTVVIGEGKGQNWWCVLFPPLCLIGVEAPEQPERELPLARNSDLSFARQDPLVTEIYRNAITEEKYRQLIRLLEEGQEPGNPSAEKMGDRETSQKQTDTSLKLRFKTLEMIQGKCVGK